MSDGVIVTVRGTSYLRKNRSHNPKLCDIMFTKAISHKKLSVYRLYLLERSFYRAA